MCVCTFGSFISALQWFQWSYLWRIALLWQRWNDRAALWMMPTAVGRLFAGAVTVGTKPNHSFWPSFAYANLSLWGSILIVQRRDTRGEFSSRSWRSGFETRHRSVLLLCACCQKASRLRVISCWNTHTAHLFVVFGFGFTRKNNLKLKLTFNQGA